MGSLEWRVIYLWRLALGLVNGILFGAGSRVGPLVGEPSSPDRPLSVRTVALKQVPTSRLPNPQIADLL